MRRGSRAQPFKFGAYNYGNASVKVDENTDFYVIPVGREASVCGYKTTGTTAVFYVNQLERPIPRIEKMKYATLFFYMQETRFYPTTLRGIPVLVGKGCIFERYTGEPIVITASQSNDDTSEVRINSYKASLIRRNFTDLLRRALMNSSRDGSVTIQAAPITKPFTERVKDTRINMNDIIYSFQHTYYVEARASNVLLRVNRLSKVNNIND